MKYPPSTRLRTSPALSRLRQDDFSEYSGKASGGSCRYSFFSELSRTLYSNEEICVLGFITGRLSISSKSSIS